MIPFTLQQLRILKAIAIEQHFTKAAEILYLSQPSLSKQIKILEKNLDTLLINRERTQISLTESGKLLLHYSERILALCEEGCRAIIDLKKGDRGNLRIGASQTIGTYLMPRILTLFAQNYPQINLKLEITSTRQIIQNIQNRELEIALISHEILENFNPSLTVKPFIYDEFSLIVSKTHPFAKKKKITKKDLYDLEFLTLNSTSRIKQFIDHSLLQNQIETNQLKTILQLNSIESIKTGVSLGLGAAFVSSATIEKEIQLKIMESLEINSFTMKRKLFIVSNSESYKSKAFEFLSNELTQLQEKLKHETDSKNS